MADNPMVGVLLGVIGAPSRWRIIQYKNQDYHFISTDEIIYALSTTTMHIEAESRRIARAMRSIPEWRTHQYRGSAVLTLSSGRTTIYANGYISPVIAPVAPPVLVSDNVLPMSQPSPKKFAAP